MGGAAAIDMTLFPVAGYILDNFGRRYAAIACMSLLSLGLFLVPFTSGFTTLLLAAMLVGVGNGFGSGINMILGADFAPPKERGEFLGVWRLISDSGSFAGPIFMGYIANTFVLATALTVTSMLGLIGIFMMLFFVRETLTKESH